MYKFIATFFLGLAVTSASAAEEGRNAQNIGVGSGAVIGAIAGGPVGLIVGAAIGGHYADNVHRSGKVPGLEGELRGARGELSESEARAARLNRSLFETRSEMQKLGEEMSGLLLERAAFEGLQMEVMYPTGDSELSADASARIARLAELLTRLPDLTVRLDGYADPRGDAVYNEGLSRSRAESVRDALIAAGVSAERITLQAHGEAGSVSTEGDLDAYAFERKVRVRLIGGTGSTKVASHD